jgi:hypothetical protein
MYNSSPPFYFPTLTQAKLSSYSTTTVTTGWTPDPLGPFTVRRSGNVGQEILDSNGRIIAWTTDPWVDQVIVKLLTENEGLLGGK